MKLLTRRTFFRIGFLCFVLVAASSAFWLFSIATSGATVPTWMLVYNLVALPSSLCGAVCFVFLLKDSRSIK